MQLLVVLENGPTSVIAIWLRGKCMTNYVTVTLVKLYHLSASLLRIFVVRVIANNRLE